MSARSGKCDSYAHQRRGPLQCQKCLRLTEARRLMLDEQFSVTDAVLEVGYESVSCRGTPGHVRGFALGDGGGVSLAGDQGNAQNQRRYTLGRPFPSHTAKLMWK